MTTSSGIARVFYHIVDVREGELASLLWSFLYFFALLGGYYVLRPVREEMGISGSVERLAWFYIGTFVTTAVLVPLYSWVVARVPRRRIVPIVYHFAVFNLIVFWVLLRFHLVPRTALAPVFFVWLSAFNLFVVSVFWSLMADLFTREQGKRLFGFIAAGGSAGGLVGPLVASRSTEHIGQAQLLLIAAALVEVSVLCVSRIAGPGSATARKEPVGGSVWAAFARVIQSPYLLAVAGQTICTTVTATFLYFQQARIVQAATTGETARTKAFGNIDLYVNLTTLVVQALITGRVLTRLGLGFGLAVTPIVNALGSLALALEPRLGVIVCVQAARRASHYALERPSRDVLFTVVSAEDKYKSKSLLDTFVYRGGDALGAQMVRRLPIFASALVAIPLSAVWLALVLFLARRANVARHEEARLPPGSSGEPVAPAE